MGDAAGYVMLHFARGLCDRRGFPPGACGIIQKQLNVRPNDGLPVLC
jgi:hypothetical protein